MEDEYGLIYGLTNKYFPGLVKIGVTRDLDVSKRMRVLGTAVPEPFDCAFAYKVPRDKLFSVEHILHDAFGSCRIGNSEFFKIDPGKVDKLMLHISEFEPMRSSVQEAIKAEEGTKRAKNMDFPAMGLEVGSVLYFKNDRTIQCTVASKNRVNYKDKQNVSLTSITQELLGLAYSVQPSPHWFTEDGMLLIDKYKLTQYDDYE